MSCSGFSSFSGTTGNSAFDIAIKQVTAGSTTTSV
jgi:hypothetical protein